MLKIKRTTQLVVRDVPYIMHPKKAIQALRQRYGVSDHRDFASSHSHEQFKTHSIDFPYVRASDLEEGRITVLVSEAQHYAVDSKGTVRNFLPSNLEFKVRHLLGQPRKENVRQEQDYFAEVKALLEDQYPIPLETAKVAEKPKDSQIGGAASGGSGSYSTPKPVKLEFDKEVALDYWESQKDNADNFPEYFLAHMMGLNTKIGYGFAEGVANTIDTIKDPEKLKEAVSGTVNGVINTVTHPAKTLEALEKSAIEFRDLPTQQQAEILYTLGVSSLVGGRLLKRKGKSNGSENEFDEISKESNNTNSKGREEAADPYVIKQTGARSGELGPHDWDEADLIYELIRKETDTLKISQNTGIQQHMIDRIKQHLFFKDDHIKWEGLGRMDADPLIANAWRRLQNNTHTEADLKLIKHEYLESKFESIFKTDLETAHRRVSERHPSGLE
jgi:hypothetical protein